MIRFKKVLKIGLGIMMLSSVLAGCSQKVDKEAIRIATLNGPTGIGMVKLIDEGIYDTSIYQSPDEIVGKIVSGELDIACVPSNLAAVLYNKTQGGIKLLATNTLGVLYIVENGTTIEQIEDLKGKTILASGAGSTPEYILRHVLKSNGLDIEKDVTVEYYTNHTDIASQLMTQEGSIALLPQPFVTTVTMKNENIRIAVDLNEVWQQIESKELPMGTVIATSDFVDKNKKELDVFLKDYQDSVEYVNSNVDEAAALVSKHGIVLDEKIAVKAIPKCNIVVRDSQASKESLEKFYQILSEHEPKAVGGKIPDEGFYYKSK